jgi:hypothetical protein
MNVDNIKVKRISREQAPVQIIINHKQLENVEYFNYLSSITNKQAELKPGLPWQKQHSTERRFVHQKTVFKFKEEIS